MIPKYLVASVCYELMTSNKNIVYSNILASKLNCKRPGGTSPYTLYFIKQILVSI